MSQSSPTASQPAQSLLPDSTDAFTIGHLAWIAVLAVLVVIALIYGAGLRRARRRAVEEIHEHNEALESEGGGVRTPSAASTAPTELLLDPKPVPSMPDPVAREPAPLDDEPIAAAAPALTENPAAAAAPPAPAGGPSAADGPVTQLKGLGPRVAERLAANGITTVGQIAELTDDEASALDTRLGPFAGRMGRDRWLEQARFLAAGDVKGFEAVFGRL